MLLALLAHITITFGCLLGGMFFYGLFPQKNVTRPVIFYLVSGLILLTAVVQFIVLFFPIGLYTQLSITAIILVSCVLKWNSCKGLFKKLREEFFSWSVITRILFLTIWLVLLLINAGPIMMDDTESYHLQSIKWIREYGSVPGLVNLHERFGFNTSWFSSVALFSFSNKTTGGLTALNTVLSVWFAYWCFWRYNRLQKENNLAAANAVLIILLAALIVWPLVRGNTATTNYDFIATLLVLILFIEISLSTDFSFTIEWIIWPAFLFTVRIINFPLLLLSLFTLIVFVKRKNIKPLLLSIACCLLLVIPFIIRNIIIAGYPFYPAMSLDLINVNWKPDPLMTERLLEYIKYYNRVSTTYLDIDQTKGLGSNWISSWFNYLFLFDKILVASGLTGLLFRIAGSFSEKNKTRMLLSAISVVWLVCWFFISPDPRFIYGILLFGVFLLAYLLISMIKNDGLLKALNSILIIAMITGSTYYFISKLWKEPQYRNWLVPAKLPEPPVHEFVINGITLRVPEPINNNWNARCYGTPIPCLYIIDPRLKPRGKEIQNGFRLEK